MDLFKQILFNFYFDELMYRIRMHNAFKKEQTKYFKSENNTFNNTRILNNWSYYTGFYELNFALFPKEYQPYFYTF